MFRVSVRWMLLCVCCLLFGTGPAIAKESPQQWQIVVPTGIIEQARIAPAPRLTSLEGKTVALRWNGKHNGNIVLDRLGELLIKKVPSIKIVKIYEIDPTTNHITGNDPESRRVADVVKKTKPDLVIGAQAD